MAKSSARRRALARAKWERQEQRRIEHDKLVKSRERIVVGVVVVAVVGILGGLGLRQLVSPTSVAVAPVPATTVTPTPTAAP